MKNEQKLIDILFEISLTIHSSKHKQFFEGMSQELLAAWIAEKLRNSGFDTLPIGSSWGVLKNSI